MGAGHGRHRPGGNVAADSGDRHQHWSWQVVAGMLAILLVASWCARVAGTYGAVLIVRRDRGTWYRAQMISSLGTLALLGAAWALHGLNAFSAMLINVAGMVYLGLAYFSGHGAC